MEPKPNSLPIVVAFGETGAGKSYIMNNLSGGTDVFKVGNSLRSETCEFKELETSLLGNDYLPKVKLIDTVGFNDNSAIRPNLFKEAAEFFVNAANNISVVLLVVPLVSSRLNIQSFKTMLSMMGRKLSSTSNLIIVYTQFSRLNEKEKTIALEKYALEAKSILLSHNIKLESQFFLYDDNKNGFNELIIRLVKTNELYIPPIYENIKELKKLIPGITNETALLRASVNNEEFKEFLKEETENAKNIVKDLKEISKIDPDNEEARNAADKAEENLKELTGGDIAEFIASSTGKLSTSVAKEILLNSVKTATFKLVRTELSKESTKFSGILVGNFLSKEITFVGKIGGEQVTKLVSTSGLKQGSKVTAKALPIIGFAVGLGFGIWRFCHGEVAKGLAEIGAGACSFIPVYGTAASIGASAAIAAWDVIDIVKKTK